MKRVTALPFALMLAAIMAVVFSSCKKEEPDVTPQTEAKTKFELLTGSNWVLTAFTLDGENKFDDIPNCEKDNINKYLPNGDYLYDVGQSKCGTEQQVRSVARWEFADNEITLKRSDGFEVSILNIDANQLIVEEKSQNGAIAHYEYKAIPTFTNILLNASKPWRLIGLTYNGIDAYNNLIACEKDNKLFFFTSGKYTFDEGATTCAPNAPQVMESKWFFADNETQIKIGKTLYALKEINATKLVIEFVEDNIIYTYTPN